MHKTLAAQSLNDEVVLYCGMSQVFVAFLCIAFLLLLTFAWQESISGVYGAKWVRLEIILSRIENHEHK